MGHRLALPLREAGWWIVASDATLVALLEQWLAPWGSHDGPDERESGTGDVPLVVWSLLEQDADGSLTPWEVCGRWLAHEALPYLESRPVRVFPVDARWEQRLRDSLSATATLVAQAALHAGLDEHQRLECWILAAIDSANHWIARSRTASDTSRLVPVEELPDALQDRLARWQQTAAGLFPIAAAAMRAAEARSGRPASPDAGGGKTPMEWGPLRASESDSQLADLFPRIVRILADYHRLRDEFDSRLERVKLASLAQFAYGASHEINNPLANISTRAQALVREETDPERRRKLAIIISQALRAHEMIADLMLFAKPPQLEREPAELVALLGNVVDEFREPADAQCCKVVFQHESAALTRAVDPVQLSVAVKAIVQNALDWMGMGGTVTVDLSVRPRARPIGSSSVYSGAQEVCIQIADDGPGIPPTVREHIFDPFFSGREAGRGLGFGLSKAWRIVTDHGGNLLVSQSPSGGACFTLVLPDPLANDA